jgi:hypothetical protein
VGGAMVSGRAGFLYKEEERGERGAGRGVCLLGSRWSGSGEAAR